MKSLFALVAVALMSVSGLVMADEPVKLMEEVTVVGAVRSSDAVQVADINLPADDMLEDMPVAYE